MDFNQDDLGVRRVLGNYLAGATYENKPAILALGLHEAWLRLCYDEMFTPIDGFHNKTACVRWGNKDGACIEHAI